MSLLTIDDISLEFGDLPILRHANLTLEPNERVCLVGRNGAGKSTLLKLITGEQQPDSGEIRYRQALRISQLQQALPNELNQTVHEFVAGGLVHLGELIRQYHRLSEQPLDDRGLRELQDLQHRIDAEGGWNLDQRVETILSELDIPGDKYLNAMSGGWQRRVGLARALVSNPELLLLDEPTNHLDLAAIQWLEDRIRNFAGSVLFITHDRAFLQRLATRIVELDRTRLTSWPGDYRNFLRRKEEALHAESLDKQQFEKKLGEEEAWIRQGIKARRTRNEGRVRALEAMREEYAERQKLKRQSKARIHIEESDNESGRKVIELHSVSHGYGGEPLINKLSLKVLRGDRIGLVGNNGVGKSTLLKIMLGELTPDSGTVKLGTNLDTGYFDQMRRELDPNKTIAEVVGDGREYIRIGGKDRHVIGYLRGFLFSAKRAMTPVRALSGGEKNRVILARLFTRPTNLLVLDEPTNDLDVETLEVLEEKLVEYQGTLIVVSHDREFLDNAVTSVLAFEEGGRVQSYAGGYSQWLKHGRRLKETDDLNRGRNDGPDASADATAPAKPKKLSYKHKLELEQLPDRIEQLEQQIADLEKRIADPEFYNQAFEKVQPVMEELKTRQAELDQAMARWDELENQQA
ncbi:ATP-binding cassette subfamily F protein uup [Methylohalomonas lacus]|uniref:ATP-binding protein Uup n=1 Tax=Methylohalomonas lacus TaxID=398773 RepID=A0AAE3L1T5_9GAMM|nr:ATP-binding cassette domain-containing protein [Methylohalomonas lacus]MCS3904060.1 ATP-binding cassette subfamily F protein uup [Methylohalomonas lacus]